MRKQERITLQAGATAMTLALLLATGPLAAQAPDRVVLDTDLGQIEIEVDAASAPHDAALFLRYVDLGLLDDAVFQQVVRFPASPRRRAPLSWVSAEVDASHREEAARTTVPERPLSGRRPAVSGGVLFLPSLRNPKAFDLAICLDDGGGDRALSPFGTVVRGLDIVRRIAERPAHGQQLDEGVRILRARRVHEEAP
jgi:peptidyl-prolyl cis-trans isomerase A (cyclophilin A)